jgi:hypothetical protein
MNHEDAIKHALVQVHAKMDRVQELGDRAVSFWAEAKEMDPASERRAQLVGNIADLAETCLEMVNRAGFESSVLCALLQDQKEKNAVVLQCLEAVSAGYGKLLTMHKCLAELAE